MVKRRNKKYDIDRRTLTETKKIAILDKYNNECGYCYSPAITVDHILPWSFIHDNSDENLVACCWLCNVLASNFIFDTFDEKREYLLKRRRKFLDTKIIPIWLSEEVDALGGTLRSRVRESVVEVGNEAERQRLTVELCREGFRVMNRAL